MLIICYWYVYGQGKRLASETQQRVLWPNVYSVEDEKIQSEGKGYIGLLSSNICGQFYIILILGITRSLKEAEYLGILPRQEKYQMMRTLWPRCFFAIGTDEMWLSPFLQVTLFL